MTRRMLAAAPVHHSTLAGLAGITSLARPVTSGVIVDVESVEQALAAELAGASALRLKLRGATSGSRSSLTAAQIREVVRTVALPTIAIVRANHTVEAQVMKELGVTLIAPIQPGVGLGQAKEPGPFQQGLFWPCCDLASALDGIRRGAVALFVSCDFDAWAPAAAVPPLARLLESVRALSGPCSEPPACSDDEEELELAARSIRQAGGLPIPCFGGGEGVVSPIDAALCVQWGADGVVLGSAVFRLPDPQKHIAAVVAAVLRPSDPAALVDALLRSEEASHYTDITHRHPAHCGETSTLTTNGEVRHV